MNCVETSECWRTDEVEVSITFGENRLCGEGMPGSRLFYYQDLKQFLRVFLLPPFSPPQLILLDALERKQHFYLFEMETIGFGRATFISPLGNLRDDLIEFHS